MYRLKAGVLIVLMLLIPSLTSAGVLSEGYAVDIRFLSTLGFGVEIQKSITPNFAARLGANAFAFGTETEYEAENSDQTALASVDLTLQTLEALVDWYPKAGAFHLTGGFMINENAVNTEMSFKEPMTQGSRTYTPEEIGTVTSELSWDKLAPYFGLGWGHPAAMEKRVGWVFDLGVMYQNSPHVDLEATGLAWPTAEPDQERSMEEDLEGAKAWFVMSLGITFRIK